MTFVATTTTTTTTTASVVGMGWVNRCGYYHCPLGVVVVMAMIQSQSIATNARITSSTTTTSMITFAPHLCHPGNDR